MAMPSAAAWLNLPRGRPVAYRDPGTGQSLDLHDALVPNPLSTFFMRVQGDGLMSHGIGDGDLLVIDRSLPLRNGAVVVIVHAGQFLIRPLQQQGDHWLALPLRRPQTIIPIPAEETDPSVLFGVVSHAIHQLQR